MAAVTYSGDVVSDYEVSKTETKPWRDDQLGHMRTEWASRAFRNVDGANWDAGSMGTSAADSSCVRPICTRTVRYWICFAEARSFDVPGLSGITWSSCLPEVRRQHKYHRSVVSSDPFLLQRQSPRIPAHQPHRQPVSHFPRLVASSPTAVRRCSYRIHGTWHRRLSLR